MSEAREAVLTRVRAALRDVPETEMPDQVGVARAYRSSAPTPRQEVLDTFVDIVSDYKATVQRVSKTQLTQAIADALGKRGAKRLVIPKDLPESWQPEGFDFVKDTQLSHSDLDQCDGVLTGCAVAVAQTGTIILDGSEAQGRRAISLLPDYHLCIVQAEQVVNLIPEAVRMLEPAVKRGQPITLISGPSATSDIELSRVEGVHGPRTLEVLLVDEHHLK